MTSAADSLSVLPTLTMDLFSPSQKDAAAPDAGILTVTQLTRRVKEAMERQVGSVWVQGEISNHRLQSSGHHYFTLKDAGAQLGDRKSVV